MMGISLDGTSISGGESDYKSYLIKKPVLIAHREFQLKENSNFTKRKNASLRERDQGRAGKKFIYLHVWSKRAKKKKTGGGGGERRSHLRG